MIRIITAAALAALLVSPALGQPFSDNFAGKTLNPGWTVVSPNPASSVGLNGHGSADLNASALNGGSDLFDQTNYNAPVILQSVPGGDNWTISTEVLFSPSNNYQSAGVLLAYQAGGFSSTSQFDRAVEHAYYPDGGGEVVRGPNGGSPIQPYSGGKIYLKVNKTGKQAKGWTYTSYYSPDGHAWTQIGSQTVAMPYTYIGLFSIRQPWDGVTTVNSDALFNYFEYKMGK